MNRALQLTASFLLFQASLPAYAADPIQRVFAVWDVSNAGASSRPRNQSWTLRVKGWGIASQIQPIPVGSSGTQLLRMRPPGAAAQVDAYIVSPAAARNFNPPVASGARYMCAYLDSTDRGIRGSSPVISIVSTLVNRPGINTPQDVTKPAFFASPEACRNLDRSLLPVQMPSGPNKLPSWR